MGKILKALEKVKAQKKAESHRKITESEDNFLQMDVSTPNNAKPQSKLEEEKNGLIQNQKSTVRKGRKSKEKPNKTIRTVFSRPQAQDINYALPFDDPDKNELNNYALDRDDQEEIQSRKECTIDKDEIARKLLELRQECSKQNLKKISTSKNHKGSEKCREDLVTLHRPSSIISEQFKVARALVSKLIKMRDLRTILVTSSLPLEGKSFIASNLAVSMARGLDEHVLLVDADLTSPSLQNIFQINSNKGLSDFLVCENYELSNFIKKTKVPKLSLLPAGSFFERSSELLASELMKLFIQEVKYRYDDRIIIFDSSPLIISQSLAISDKVDGVIIVVKAGKTDRKLVNKAVEMIGRKRIVGIIMNYCNVSSWKYAAYFGKERSGQFG
jgi:protein-tyrosine kinase